MIYLNELKNTPLRIVANKEIDVIRNMQFSERPKERVWWK